MFTRLIASLCAAILLTATSAAAQFVQQPPPLETLSELADEYYGYHLSMSADGNTVVASVLLLNQGDVHAIPGAYVWSRQGAGWQAPTVLLAPTSAGGIDDVAVSGDGNTIMVGNSGRGVVWVWRRSGGTWIQDGKLAAGGVELGAFLFDSLALSYDGVTAIVSAPRQSAAYIWSRQTGVWAQTAKLLPDNRIGAGGEGGVSLSADGNIALVGIAEDNNGTGAAWIWERTNGGWRQGPKLVASTAIGGAHQGTAVALSADGQTAIVGGPEDDHGIGGSWIWTRASGGWSEVAKLVAPASRNQGQSVSLSADGRVALVGGVETGGALLWIKSGNSWPQEETTLHGTWDKGGCYLCSFTTQGVAVALSSDGTTALSSGPGLESRDGALFVFSAPPTPLRGPDMDGDGIADLAVWQPLTGRWKWQTAVTGFDAARAGSVSWGRGDYGDVPLTGDVDGDRIDDLIVYRTTTGVWNWLTSSSGFTRTDSKQWGVPSLGDRPMLADMEGDGVDDLIVWRPSTGMWYYLTSSTGYDPQRARSVAWGSGSLGDVPLTGDFDGDGRADVAVWRPTDNTFYWWNSRTNTVGSRQWGVSAVGDIPMVADMDGDRRADLVVWRPGNGTFYWLLSSTNYSPTAARSTAWGFASVGDTPSLADMDGDGRADLVVWRTTTGEYFWLKSSTGYSPSNAGYLNMLR